MQFDSSDAERRLRPPPNYQSRSVQVRLLTLVGLLFLVIICMQHAAKPSTWQWLWGSSPTREAVRNPSNEESTNGVVRRGIRFDPDFLESVTDDTHFRNEESQAWFLILKHLRDASDAQLKANSLGIVTRLQLSQQTKSYRGKVVDLHGTVKRAHRVKAAENAVGIENYWQCWMFLDNSPAEPVVVYALKMPADFHDGMDIDYRAQLSGIVFKRWAYQSAEDLTVAPVVLTKHIQLTNLKTKNPSSNAAKSVSWAPLTVLAVATTSLLTVALLFYWSGKKSRHKRQRNIPVVLPLGDAHGSSDHSAESSES